MKKNRVQNLMLLVGASAYNLLFWQEKLGVNAFLFSSLIIAYLLVFKPKIRTSKPAVTTAIGTILLSLLIIWNNSLFSKIMYTISFITFIGFTKEQSLRFVWFGFIAALISLVKTPLKLFQDLFSRKGKSIGVSTIWRTAQISLIPLLVLFLFYLIYYLGNSNFSQISDSFWATILPWLQWDISFRRILFFITGVIVVGGMISHFKFPYFKKLQNLLTEKLLRTRRANSNTKIGTIALKNEYRVALITVFSLNVLLFIVNLIDISFVWFGYNETIIQLRKAQYVHEGTYTLIFSILMAMTVLLIFFRRNLNFYPKQKMLKTGAYIWIFQNTVLGVSLLIRDFRYIDYHGLAYKRIGVMIFLILVFIGLISMFYKIQKKRSNYFLWHRNSWALYFVMLFCCFINWDTLITRYNLNFQTKTKIDFKFLIDDVSDKNLYFLIDYQSNNSVPNYVRNKIEFKKRNFLKSQNRYSWLSWNYSDYRNNLYLETNITD
jgi:Domain of unknown function (DUF4153)